MATKNESGARIETALEDVVELGGSQAGQGEENEDDVGGTKGDVSEEKGGEMNPDDEDELFDSNYDMGDESCDDDILFQKNVDPGIELGDPENINQNKNESSNESNCSGVEKPIITIFEWIREYLMKRLQVNRDRAEAKWKSRVCPKIRTILDKHTRKVGDCMPIKSNNTHYQISCNDGRQFCVDLGSFSCTYRKWGLSGILCKHALCAIYDQEAQLEDYVHSYYIVETYKKVYSHAIYGINSQDLRGDTLYIPPLPPNFKRTGGRPATARRRGVGEPVMKKKKRSRGNTTQKLKRQTPTIKCRCCGEAGHNKATCPHRPQGSKQPEGSNQAKRRRVRKKATVNGQPTACNPQSSGTGMRTLLPPAQQAKTEDEETMSHHVGPLSQPQSEMIPPLRVPGPSMFN
ncbi:hypothetical protein BUALT_Bualt17G0002600 [Buddleja alternifolia]|uniref:CCHC-type domain-containing protein n=1 Tax=Buddleja alternifolia TaxID=168488 RepID=A0AAV6W6G9_9LAMI|nr:hypothetical protein BUALT_Bualt17G0002600 [Buddleja alternifolia]